jgi:hypothetical protein
MKIATPAAQSSVDHSSTSTLSHSSSDAVISEDAVPSIGKASSGSSLVRSILQAHGKEILEFASDQFLDLAVAIRLKTIGARELVGLLAEAERLGYGKADIIDDNDYDGQVQVACESPRSSLDAIRTSKPPATIDVQCHSVSTAPSQPSSLEELRAPKRTSTARVREGESLAMNQHVNTPDTHGSAALEKEHSCSVQSIQGVISMRNRIQTIAGSAGRQGQRKCSRVGSGPQVAAHVTKSSNILKRPHAQQTQNVHGGFRTQSRNPTRLVKASGAGQSGSTSAKHTELVIISDSEPEPEVDDNN